MKFLIEKSILTPDQQVKLSKETTEYGKRKYLTKIAKDIQNYDKWKNAKDTVVDSISKEDDDAKNEFLTYIKNLKVSPKEEDLRLIRTLIDNGSLNPDENWLGNADLYNSPESEFLIKALTYASNKDLQRNSDQEISIEDMFSDGKLKSVEEIKQVLTSINTRPEEKPEDDSKLANLGSTVLKAELKKQGLEFTKESVREYVKGLAKDKPGNMKTVVDQIIDAGNMDAQIGKLLQKKYQGSVMQEPIEELNAELADAVDKTLNSSLGGGK